MPVLFLLTPPDSGRRRKAVKGQRRWRRTAPHIRPPPPRCLRWPQSPQHPPAPREGCIIALVVCCPNQRDGTRFSCVLPQPKRWHPDGQLKSLRCCTRPRTAGRSPTALETPPPAISARTAWTIGSLPLCISLVHPHAYPLFILCIIMHCPRMKSGRALPGRLAAPDSRDEQCLVIGAISIDGSLQLLHRLWRHHCGTEGFCC